MNYEEKYKQALERARDVYTYYCDDREQLRKIESIFPELKENEDEKNIKDLIDELKCSLRSANCQNEACNGGHEKRIALLEWSINWLEKQGKQKPADKVEPKFKVGDKVHCGDENQPVTIIDITDDSYITDSIIGPILFSEEDNWTKIEQNYTWCEDDEEILKWLCRIIHSQRISKEITSKEELELVEWMDKWLNYNPQTKQGNKLDADKVIAWLVANICDYEYYVKRFKQDFGLWQEKNKSKNIC